MPLPELLDELFRLYRRNFSVIIGIALLVALPGLIWSLVTGTYKLSASTYSNLFTFNGGATATPIISQSQLQQMLGSFALGGLGGLILLPFSIGAVYRAVTDISLGRPVTIAGVLKETLARYLPLFGLIALVFAFFIIWVIASVIGLILLILPFFAVAALGAFVSVRFSLVVAAMMAEDIGPIEGLRRSWNLVAGSWWRTLGVLFVVAVLQSVIGFALGLLFGLFADTALSGDLRLAVVSAGSTLLNAAVSPVFAIGVVLLYFDLRTRKEGLDLDQLARETSPGPATP